MAGLRALFTALTSSRRMVHNELQGIWKEATARGLPALFSRIGGKPRRCSVTGADVVAEIRTQYLWNTNVELLRQ
jgi:hypothetical protein